MKPKIAVAAIAVLFTLSMADAHPRRHPSPEPSIMDAIGGALRRLAAGAASSPAGIGAETGRPYRRHPEGHGRHGWEYFAQAVRPSGRCGGDREVGASYYDSGRWTSSGERFDPSALAAASNVGGFGFDGRKPNGTSVRIRNPATGLSVTVRINDTLPNTGAAWRAGDRLDLTPAAFRALGMKGSGWVCAS
jgi:hypothetical protein